MVLHDAFVEALAVRPGGGALVGGWLKTEDGTGQRLFARLGNGLPDPTFGTEGTADLSHLPGVPGQFHGATAIRIDPVGRILVAGSLGAETYYSEPGWLLARLDSTGALDRSFGVEGVLVGRLPSFTQVGTLAVQADGAILVGLSIPTQDPAGRVLGYVLRVRPEGTLDTSFAAAGTLQTGEVRGLAPLGDGSLLVASRADGCFSQLMRADPSGQPDPSFGSGGAHCLDGLKDLQAMAVDGRGCLVVAGWTAESPAGALLRLLPNGQPDLAFGVGGFAPLKCGDASCDVVAAGADGRVGAGVSGYLSGGRGADDQGLRQLTWLDHQGAMLRHVAEPGDLLIAGLAFDEAGGLYVAATLAPSIHHFAADVDFVLLRFAS